MRTVEKQQEWLRTRINLEIKCGNDNNNYEKDI